MCSDLLLNYFHKPSELFTHSRVTVCFPSQLVWVYSFRPWLFPVLPHLQCYAFVFVSVQLSVEKKSRGYPENLMMPVKNKPWSYFTSKSKVRFYILCLEKIKLAWQLRLFSTIHYLFITSSASQHFKSLRIQTDWNIDLLGFVYLQLFIHSLMWAPSLCS